MGAGRPKASRADQALFDQSVKEAGSLFGGARAFSEEKRFRKAAGAGWADAARSPMELPDFTDEAIQQAMRAEALRQRSGRTRAGSFFSQNGGGKTLLGGG